MRILFILQVKTLLTIRPETETPVGAAAIRKIPRYNLEYNICTGLVLIGVFNGSGMGWTG